MRPAAAGSNVRMRGAGAAIRRGHGRAPPAMTRNRVYFALMAVCVLLVALAWTVVRIYSVTIAVIMSVAAMAIPPIAVIIVNAGDESSRRPGGR